MLTHDHEADALPQAAGELRLSDCYRPERLIYASKRGPAFKPQTPATDLMCAALTAAGDLLQHLQRGAIVDALSAYDTLRALAGHDTPAPVRVDGIPADGAARAVAAALANISANDARRHWYYLHCLMFTLACRQADMLARSIDFEAGVTDSDIHEDGPSSVDVLARQRDACVQFILRSSGERVR